MEKFTISIIIPILNEEESIGILLSHLIKNSSKEHIAEIISAANKESQT